MDYIQTFGYLGLIIWTFLGGEEGVIFAGVLARARHFNLIGAILATALGGTLGDQIYFYLARQHAGRLLKRSERLARAYPQAQRLVAKYGVAVVLVSRFLLGLRITVAVVCGSVKMHAPTYSVLSLISALLWASVYGISAYYFGPAVWDRVLKQPIGLMIVLTFLLSMAVVVWIGRRRARRSSSTPSR